MPRDTPLLLAEHRVVAATSLQAFMQGLTAPLAGFAYMRRRPTLWRYGVTPVLLNVLLTAFVLVIFVVSAVALASYLHPRFPEGAWGVLLEILSVAALVALALGLTAAVWLLLQGLLCSHFYEQLAREVEQQLGVAEHELRDVPTLQQIRDAIHGFVALLGINGGLLALNCIPLVGSLAAVCGAFYFDALFFGGECLSYPLSLRGMRRRERREFSKRHRQHTLGLGAAVLLMSIIPIFGAVGLTTGVAGAVLLHRRLAGIPSIK